MSRLTWFALGVIVAALLLRSGAVEAADSLMMFGSFSGAATAITVTTDGYVNVVLH